MPVLNRLQASAPAVLPRYPQHVIACIGPRVDAGTASQSNSVVLINRIGESAAKAPVFLGAVDGQPIDIGLPSKVVSSIS